MKKVEAYRCQHCGKLYLRPHACEYHENNLCLLNPVLRPLCYNCKNYKPWIDTESEEPKDKIKVYKGYDEWPVELEFTPNRCAAQPDIKLFFNYRIKDETYEALIDTDEYVPMPLSVCPNYEPYKRDK